MNFSHYFIKRPIFAGVLSIAVFIMADAGLVLLLSAGLGGRPAPQV